jgi:hypothetical protein
MKRGLNFWEIARRAETGQILKESDFELGVIFKNCCELAKEHDITFDPDHLVIDDKTLADDLWEAGYELFLRSGIYNLSTKRVMKFAEEEVKEALRFLKGNYEVGSGKDKVLLTKNRGDRRPILFAGPFGAEISCDMFISINQAFAQEPLTDVLFGPGHIQKIHGISEIRRGSPFEIEAAISAMNWTFDALRKAGRPGMPVSFMQVGGVSSMNEISADCPNGVPRSDHFRVIFFFPDLKIDDVQLSKIVHFRGKGYRIYTDAVSLIGGIAGGPEGSAISAIAYFIASVVISGAEVVHLGANHIKYISQTNPASLWVSSIVPQSVQRNSNIIPTISITTAARPGCLQNLLEIASAGATISCSGGNVTGPRAATPIGANCVNPLDARLLGEVMDKCYRMSKGDVNEIVKRILRFYINDLEPSRAPKGLHFEELYEVDTIAPNKRNEELYQEAQKILADNGLEI